MNCRVVSPLMLVLFSFSRLWFIYVFLHSTLVAWLLFEICFNISRSWDDLTRISMFSPMGAKRKYRGGSRGTANFCVGEQKSNYLLINTNSIYLLHSYAGVCHTSRFASFKSYNVCLSVSLSSHFEYLQFHFIRITIR